jgi:hypothetical protein
MVGGKPSTDADNPYLTPAVANVIDRELSEPRRRLRFRLIPAVLLWALSAPILLGGVFGMCILAIAYVQHVWIEQDPETWEYLLQDITNPPTAAMLLSILGASLCGMWGGVAWMRGNWWRAIQLSTAFGLLIAFSMYLDAGPQ